MLGTLIILWETNPEHEESNVFLLYYCLFLRICSYSVYLSPVSFEIRILQDCD